VAGKTYLPCRLDVLVQGRPQLLHCPVKFLFVSNYNRPFNRTPDPVNARQSSISFIITIVETLRDAAKDTRAD
jgi:hypothetical protein